MLSIGVVGVGSISEEHIRPYKQNKRVNLMAFCDINEARLKLKGERHGVENLYTDYHALLANSDVDAVSICTWNNTHAEIAVAALEAGKHVLIEKPLSITVAQAEAVQAAAEKSGKIAQVGFVRRFDKNAKLLKQFIDNGDLGEIYYAKASYLRRLGNPGGWFSDKSRSGGGPLVDLGVHVIDLTWYLMGKPRPVSVTGNTYNKLGNRSHVENLDFYQASDYTPENNVEDLANALIRFENGASLFIDASFTLHSAQDEGSVRLYGDKGGAEIEPKFEIVTEKHNTIINATPQISSGGFSMDDGFSGEINHFVTCCIDDEQTIAPVSDGVEIMKILNAVYESAETGKEVYL